MLKKLSTNPMPIRFFKDRDDSIKKLNKNKL
jgi:hypothetical protein